MQDNNITELLDGTFHGLNNLKTLDLRNNSLKTISEIIFAPLNSLENVNLENNKEIWMPQSTFIKNTNLKKLGLNEEMCTKTDPNEHFKIECKEHHDYQCKCLNTRIDQNFKFILIALIASTLVLLLILTVIIIKCRKFKNKSWTNQTTPRIAQQAHPDNLIYADLEFVQNTNKKSAKKNEQVVYATLTDMK